MTLTITLGKLGSPELELELTGQDWHEVEAALRAHFDLSDEQTLDGIEIQRSDGFVFDANMGGCVIRDVWAWANFELESDERDVMMLAAYFNVQSYGPPDGDLIQSELEKACEKFIGRYPNNRGIYSYEVCLHAEVLTRLDKQDRQFFDTERWFEYQENSAYYKVRESPDGRTVWIFQD